MNNVQVNGADIEKVSRHCPALKVLHLFFVNFQVTQLSAKGRFQKLQLWNPRICTPTFLLQNQLDMTPHFYKNNTIKAGGSTARAQNV